MYRNNELAEFNLEYKNIKISYTPNFQDFIKRTINEKNSSAYQIKIRKNRNLCLI